MRGRVMHGLAVFAVFVGPVALGPAAAQADSPGGAGTSSSEFIQFQNFQTHSRISFRIDSSVPVQWEETPQGFSLFFKGASLVDFGAPFGDEERWSASFAELKNPRLRSIRFRELSDGVRVEGSWKFQSGPNSPAEPRMETFNYRESNPPRFVVDFWPKPGVSVAEIKSREALQAKRAALLKVRSAEQARAARRLALEKAREEQNDLVRFCREKLSNAHDIFLPFKPIHDEIDFVKYLPRGAPDQDFTYFRPKGGEPDAEYVRLALDLYQQEKYALALRTLEFLFNEHPKTAYRNEMQFLRANALLKLEMKSEAERALEGVRLDAKGLPVALHSALYLARGVLEKKSPLATQESFSWLIENYPGNRLSWLFHLIVAESLYQIDQTERASQEYQWVVENAPDDDKKALAALRIGDLYLSRMQYEQALGAYLRGIRHFPEQARKNASVHLNLAEALVGLEEYDDAKKEFESAIRDFPENGEGWRGTLRLGEIAARGSADAHKAANDAASSRRWYYETINRFPFSPGATIARLRLLPCEDHGGFNAESAARFFSIEAKNFDHPGELAMAKYPDLRAQARVRSLIAFDEDEKAMAAIREESSEISSPELKQEFRLLNGALLRRVVLAKLHGKAVASADKPNDSPFYEALAFYQDHRDPGNDAGVDPDYLLELSHAASELGLGNVAKNLADNYRRISAGGRELAAQGTGAQAADDGSGGLEKNLKISDERFAEAEALWISSVEKNEDEIRSKLDQVVTESRYAFEKEVILGLLEEKKAKPATAFVHIAKAELLAENRNIDRIDRNNDDQRTQIRIQGWLAAIEEKRGDSGAALEIYRKIEKQLMPLPKKSASQEAAHRELSSRISETGDELALHLTLLGVPAPPTLEQVLLSEGLILEHQSRWGEAATVYNRAVETGLGGNQARYGLARAWIKSGSKASRKKALALLGEIATGKASNARGDDFWKNLAQKTLEVEQGSESSGSHGGL